MIRLIQRRLIIPQGDTGTFTIPIQGSMEQDDIAILAIYDPLTQKTLLNLEGTVVENNLLTFNFNRECTLKIEPSNRYLWDIVIYRNAEYDRENQQIIYADSVDSYYAAFKLPTCEIRVVTSDVQK